MSGAENGVAPKTAEEHKELGNAQYRLGNYRKAIEHYNDAITADDGKTAAYFGNRSAAYVMLDKHREAIRDCESAIAIDPKFTKASSRAAKSYLTLGEIEKAKYHNQQVLLADPKNETSLEDLKTISRIEKELVAAQQCLKDENYHKAMAHTNIVTQFCPQALTARIYNMRALLGLGKLQEVMTIAGDMMKDHPNNEELLLLRGIALFYSGNNQTAIKHFRQILNSDPDNIEAKIYLKKANLLETKKQEGNECFRLGKNQEAYDLYTECLEIDAKNVSANAVLYCNRAAALTKMKKYDSALQDIAKCLELDPGYTKAISRRAAVYQSLEKFDDAIRDYERLLQMDPENSEYYSNLNNCKREKKLASRKDYYKILGLERNADENAIKKAYKKQALKWHPDKHSESDEAKKNADEKFKEVGEAYAVLSDPMKKRRYDLGEDDSDRFGGGGHPDVDVSEIFNMFFGGRGGQRGGNPFGQQHSHHHQQRGNPFQSSYSRRS